MWSNNQSQLTSRLERSYRSKGRFSVQEVINDNEYIYHDNERGVDFYASIWKRGWGDSAIVPFAHTTAGARLNRGIMYAKREEAVKLAEGYGLALYPIEGIIPDGSTDNETIYVKDYSQLDDFVKLFIELSKLYDLERNEYLDGGAAIYYCSKPEDTEERSNAVYLDTFEYNVLKEETEDSSWNNEIWLRGKLEDRWRYLQKSRDGFPKAEDSLINELIMQYGEEAP